MQMGPWGMLLMHLPQVAVAERSYADLGFLHTKNKGFLRKDVRIFFLYCLCVIYFRIHFNTFVEFFKNNV